MEDHNHSSLPMGEPESATANITCNSVVEAAALAELLRERGMECEIYDETNSKVARGVLDSTVAVMVNLEDYEQARSLYVTMQHEQQAFTPWCPECGSENVELISQGRFSSEKAPGCLASIISMIPFTTSLYSKCYRCQDCGKEFEK